MARRRLSHKYFVLFVTLVSGALLASGAQEIYFSYQESEAALSAPCPTHAMSSISGTFRGPM